MNEGDSVVGGDSPSRAEGEEWPTCVHCQREMGFVMQIHLTEELVSVLMGVKSGLFQFWNCWYCLPGGEAYADARDLLTFEMSEGKSVPYGSSRLLARWTEGGGNNTGPRYPSEQNLLFLKKLLPEAVLSLPHPFDEQFTTLEDDERDAYWDAARPYLNEDTLCQIGGYPAWMQDGRWPRRPATGRPADFILALGTGDTDVLWGDTGFYYFFAEQGKLAEPFVLEQTL
ncbi:hypothetical protein GCM10017781_23420 [Deinococcus metalli]|nr:hypothetical protein GCM10017781_23420 [Deinococcus metalli]